MDSSIVKSEPLLHGSDPFLKESGTPNGMSTLMQISLVFLLGKLRQQKLCPTSVSFRNNFLLHLSSRFGARANQLLLGGRQGSGSPPHRVIPGLPAPEQPVLKLLGASEDAFSIATPRIRAGDRPSAYPQISDRWLSQRRWRRHADPRPRICHRRRAAPAQPSGDGALADERRALLRCLSGVTPGEEFVEACDLVVGDLAEHPCKPGLWIDVVQRETVCGFCTSCV